MVSLSNMWQLLKEVEWKRAGGNFVNYFKLDGYRSDARVNGLLWAETFSRMIASFSSKEGASNNFGKLAIWFQGLQAVKGLFSFAAAKESYSKGRYVHAAYEIFFWGGDAVQKMIEASEFNVTTTTNQLVTTVRNLGALCGVISSKEDLVEAWNNITGGRKAQDGTTALSLKEMGFEKEEHQKGADILRLAGASFLLAWTALQLVGKEFKKIENALIALRVTYSLFDMMWFVAEESLKQGYAAKSNNS